MEAAHPWSRNDVNRDRGYLWVGDDEESDCAQADKEPLARSMVPTGLMNVNTGTTRWRSTVVSNASRRSLIEDDEIDIVCSCDGTT